MNQYETQMSQLLTEAGYPHVSEYRFHPKRRWRFDFVLEPVKTKIAIEVEGGTWGKSRHGWGKGFSNDCIKYNTASLMGWIILRYTPDTMTDVIEDLKTLSK